ncbi:MAG: histidine phosphatase family protein [Planctomycetales bacterium]|nr:histidine phosphatase family protein [Planctomycetales bacterium]
MSLTLLLVRHARSDLNRQHRFTGRRDPPLDEGGRAMAEALAADHGGEGWEAVWSSPLRRALETATPVARRAGLPVTTDPDLVELSLGEWEGLTPAEARARDPGTYAAWEADPARHAPPGGETAEAVAARALAAIGRLRAAHPAGRVLVVAHKATVRLVACSWLGIPLSRFRAAFELPLTGVCEFALASTPRLVRWADTSHLPPALRAEAED